MVFFALTPHGLPEILELALTRQIFVWLNHGLLSELDMSHYRNKGLLLTNFVHWIDPHHPSQVEDAVATIREHHPHEVLYIERISHS